ncbi:protein kinase domain-containing protein [Histoplasma capsulatum]|uniref:Protein kinase domain-containing protein n=1 Tax=Ajellomyces capsulatus TaxID=5037 RepID=A0A8A1MKG2_AJECA|nr:predicted protein [Histoplasma mississippiense (nom. inval.)]EDN05620.1 predicted protein [Histoplasma mississippiense (nom. inval.)]QSS65153.1 protein kinase domain-containing protein [Histoplasma capsulatum]
MDASLVLLQYVAEFVTAADHLQPNDIRIVGCDNEDGVQLNRKLRRTGTDWVVVEHKSVAAYNAHRSQILDLARGGGNEPKRAKRGEPALRSSRAGTTAGTRAHVRQEMRRSSRLIEAASRLHSKLDLNQFTPQRTLTDIANSSPLVLFTVVSEFRTASRQLTLKRISVQKAWDVVLDGNSSDLPETTPDGEITYHADTVVEEPLCLLGMEKLGSGICGIAYDSLLLAGTSEEPCAIKVNEHDFQSFVREVEGYERLQGKTFIPKCYGGFAGIHQALACLEQLHDEGYHQEDVMASNFGLRNGQVVVLDFTHVEPCDTPRTCGNWEVMDLGPMLTH